MATLTIKPGDTLGGIAQANNTTVAELQKLNPTVTDPNKIYAGASLAIPDAVKTTDVQVPTASTVPEVPNSLDVADISSNTLPVLPAVGDQTTPKAGSIDPIIEQNNREIERLTANLQQPREAQQGVTDRILGLLNTKSNTAERTASLEQQAGIPAKVKQLEDLNLQIAEAKSAYDQAINKEGERFAPTAFVTGAQAKMQRNAAIALEGLSAQALAVQGNIEAARQRITNQVNLEFADRQNNLENLLTASALLKDQYSQKEQELLTAKEREWGLQLDKVQEEKKERETILGLAVEAVNNGAGMALYKSISEAKTVEDATALAAQFVQEQNAAETARASFVTQPSFRTGPTETDSDRFTISFAEYVQDKERELSQSINTRDPKILRELQEEYQEKVLGLVSALELTPTQYATALGNYNKTTKGTEAEFKNLPPEVQASYLKVEAEDPIAALAAELLAE